MDQNTLNELEAAMLKKRLKFLRAQGATGKSNAYCLGDDFFEQMDDHWTFCSALSDIYAVREMQDQRREGVIASTLPSSNDKAMDKKWKKECETRDAEDWWLDKKYQGPTDEEVRACCERLESEDDPNEAMDHFKRLEQTPDEVEHERAELARYRDLVDDDDRTYWLEVEDDPNEALDYFKRLKETEDDIDLVIADLASRRCN